MGPSSTLAYNQSQQQQPFYMQNSYNPDFMSISSLPGMDFLSDVATNNADHNDSTEFSFDAGGFDLGFGMTGLDLQHDWSEGQQYDLFDGFFFGNGYGAGGNGNGNGNSGGS